MDVLSEILAAVRLKGSLYFSTRFSPPWGISVPAYSNVARFHLALRGRTVARIAGVEAPVILEAGDLLVVPHGAAHTLSDDPETPCSLVDDVVRESGFTGEGALVYGGPDQSAPACLVCGHFSFEGNASQLLFAALPPFIHVKGLQSEGAGWLDEAAKFIDREARSRAPGSNAIVNRLSEILFVQAIRDYAQTAPRGLFAGLRDPQIARALAAFHADLARDWTVEALAQEAGMSRSVFSERMREVMDVTPIQYVSQWRMERAAELLRAQNQKLSRVAAGVGYQSVGAFIRSFKKYFGVGPGRYQKLAGRNIDV